LQGHKRFEGIFGSLATFVTLFADFDFIKENENIYVCNWCCSLFVDIAIIGNWCCVIDIMIIGIAVYSKGSCRRQ